jgi:tetratricopeptide (TPR) repeat protein
MSADKLKRLRIFAASPSDVASERINLETVVEMLKPMADYLGLNLQVLDWRDVVPDAGRPQQIIFDQLKPTSWDIFIGILWHRFGTPPGTKDQNGKSYLSGTEEEFKTAYAIWRQYHKPRIVIYRCTRGLPYDVDPDQLKNVSEFFKVIEDTNNNYPALYQTFDTTEAFENLLLDNLQKLLIEYGEQSKIPITPDIAQVLAPNIPNSLPRRAAFFGRTREMDIVMRALSPIDRTWGILIDGIGGIGKTSLAVEAAYRSQDMDTFDAFIFVSAKQNILVPDGIREQTSAAHTLDEFFIETARILGQTGISKLPSNEKRHALLEALRMRRVLLIYDNLETLSKEEQETMADFLRELPQGCKAIITSRRRGGEGSVWLRVGKLDWEAAQGIIKNELARDTGLSEKMPRSKSRWQELYDETNGSPLALVHTLGLLRVRAALTFEGALRMLRGAHRTSDLVKFVYQEARKELTANDNAALAALSFFLPSATFEAWMQVAGLTRNSLETSIDRLSALSLVDVLPGGENYSLHPLTRAYIHSDLLIEAERARETERAFVTYWLDYATRYGGHNYESYYLLEVEWINIKETGNWLLRKAMSSKNRIKDKAAAEDFVVLCSGLEYFLWLGGRWDDRKEMNSDAYKIAVALGDKSSASWSAYYVAWIDGLYGRNLPDKAKPWVNKCVRAWSRSGSSFRRAEAIRLRGLTAMQYRRFRVAEQLLKNALSIKKGKEHHSYSSMIIINDLGKLAFEEGRFSVAKRYYQKALAIAGEIKSKEGKAFASINIADVMLKQKHISEAGKLYKQAIPLAQKVGRIDLIARGKCGLAFVWEAKGREDKALPLAKDGLELYQRLQHPNIQQAKDLVARMEKKIKSEE